jgi:20S proteasome alpha/beta subunit
MTVVAWDGKTLASDRRCSQGGFITEVTKLYKVGHVIMGGAGSADMINEMIMWFVSGATPETFPELQRNVQECCTILAIGPDSKAMLYQSSPYPIHIEGKPFAIGAGRDFAVMAMHLGKTAKEAVELTALFCSDCGNGVDFVVPGRGLT